MKRAASFFLLAGCAWCGDPVLDAIRRDDCAGLKRSLTTAAANTRDVQGLTPLMYAATYASTGCLETLLDRGADVNAVTESGATVLFFAAHDLAKTRLLVKRGAKVSHADKTGRTALVNALGFPKNAETAAYLIDHGADAKAAGPRGNYLALAVQVHRDPALAALAKRAGVADSKLTGISYFTLPATRDSAADLLKAGYERNTQMRLATLRFPTLSALANERVAAAVSVFLDAGVGVNETSNMGQTPLMFAVAAYAPSADVVRMLLSKGADVNAKDRSGRTALDWARLQGENEAVKLLLAAGAKPGVGGAAPGPAPVAEPRDARAAIAKAVERLKPIGPAFFAKSKCISCHNQSLPSMAFHAARAKGIAVDDELLSHATNATFERWTPTVPDLMQGQCAIGGFVANTSYGMLQLASQGQRPTAVTDAVVHCMLAVQQADGSWNIPDPRPPLGTGPIKWTALAMRGIDTYVAPAERKKADAAMARGLAFLRKSVPSDTQDSAFRLLGLHWRKALQAEIAKAGSELRARQKPDGGWSQTTEMRSDAYATGQALWALIEAGGMKSGDEAYRRAAAFLLRTQLEDGSWHVRSRAIAFQPYFETGFPHGTDQFISAAATSWAVMALSRGVSTQAR